MSDAALDLLSALVLEDGRRWGEAATADQLADAHATLDQDTKAPYHYLTRARGYSKTTDLAAVNIVVLLTQAPSRARLYALAADQAQGQLLLDAIGGLMARTPELGGTLNLMEFKVAAPRTGATLTVLPADSSSVWGLKPFFGTIDELAQWHQTTRAERCYEALTTGAAKVAGSRLCVLTTSGDPSHFSKAILDRALEDDLWHVNQIAGPPPWMDPRRLEGERRRLPEASFRRLFMNEWTASDDRLANEDDLAACVTRDGPLEPKAGVKYVVGLDVGLKSDATVACVAHAEKIPGAEHPRVVLDRIQVWKGTRLRPVQLNAVEAWVEEAARRYGRARVRVDPWQAVHLCQRLRRAGIQVDEFAFSSSSVGRLATTLLQLVRSRSLALPDDPDLLDELRNVRLRESSPGVFRLDHDRNRHDDRAVALALAASWLVEHAASAQPLRTSSPVLAAQSSGASRRRRRATTHGLVLGGNGWTLTSQDGATGMPVYTPDQVEQLERQVLGRRRR